MNFLLCPAVLWILSFRHEPRWRKEPNGWSLLCNVHKLNPFRWPKTIFWQFTCPSTCRCFAKFIGVRNANAQCLSRKLVFLFDNNSWHRKYRLRPYFRLSVERKKPKDVRIQSNSFEWRLLKVDHVRAFKSVQMMQNMRRNKTASDFCLRIQNMFGSMCVRRLLFRIILLKLIPRCRTFKTNDNGKDTVRTWIICTLSAPAAIGRVPLNAANEQ